MSVLDAATKRLFERQLSPRAAAALSTALDSAAGSSDAAAAAASATAAAISATDAAASAAEAQAPLTPTTVKTANQTAAFDQIVVFNATAGALTCTAPNPVGNAGKSWGMKLVATASAHTVTAVAHAAETFDGGAAPAISVAGGLYIFTSDGTNWIITSKI